MRQKTYLSREEQWRRTVEVYSRFGWYARFAASAIGANVYLGQIVTTHSIFLPCDVVVVEVTHGAGDRYPVYAVSGKGYTVRSMYLKYQADKRSWGPLPKRKGVKSRRKLHELGLCPTVTCGSRFLHTETYESGPLRLVEHPESLEGKFPGSPDVWRFVVENLTREGFRTPGKRG